MKYKEYNDYELLYMVKEESNEAYEILQKKYEPLIYKKATEINRYMKGNGLEIKDLMQEGRLGLIEAIKNYNQDRNEFITFAYACIENRIHHINRVFKSNKNKTLNVAMDNTTGIINKGLELDNLISINVEYMKKIDFKIIKKFLTKEEYEILVLKIYGYTIEEIASIMNTTYRHITYKNGFIRKKLKKIEK